MELKLGLILFIYAVNLVKISLTQGTGTIYIGPPGNTSQTSYSFNINSGIGQQLPVFYRIINPADPSTDFSLADNVNINCEASDTQLGYSRVTFNPPSPTVTPSGPTAVNIPFNLVSAGRSVDIRCYGDSVGLVCPATTNDTIRQPQFCKSTSISSPISLTVVPVPIVSFCSPVISTAQSSFQLQLSEVVVNFPVDIFCTVDPGGSLNIVVPGVVTVDVGAQDTTVTYQVQNRGQQATVRCRANSRGGNQYLNGSSFDPETSVGTFVLDEGVVSLLPESTPHYSTSFKAFLTLDAGVETGDGISFECRAVVRATIQQALQDILTPSCVFTVPTNGTTTVVTTTPAPPTTSTAPVTTSDITSTDNVTTTLPSPTPTPTPTTAPIDISSPWLPDDVSFTFPTPGQIYKTLTVTRERTVVAPVTELVVLTCCVRTSVSPKYTNMSAAMVTSAQLLPNFCSNCTGGPVSGIDENERVIQNPSFVEVAPCPCDLTYAACDVHCCCDIECTEAQVDTFSYCLPGPFGGLPGLTPFRNCNSNHSLKEDWFPFMCVQFETNAYLGMFYSNEPVIRTESTFNILLSEQLSFFSFREKDRRYEDENSDLVGYEDGASVRTINNGGSTTSIGVLALPQRSISGSCLSVAPVRFLRDFTSDCTHDMIQGLCREDSILSARIYAESSFITHPPCPQAYQVLQQYGGSNPQIAETYVNYYCATDGASYVTSSQRLQDVVLPNESYKFPQDLYSENCTLPCDNAACLNYNQQQESSTPLPPRCLWDDGFTRPQAPSFDTATSICRNAVVDVRYVFTWTGQNIVKLNATVVMAPLTVAATNPLTVTQNFDVKFEHQMAFDSVASDNYQSVNETYDRSGRPGYDFGKPVPSGCPVYDNVTTDFLYVDTNFSRQMAIFQPGPEGLCSTATRGPLTFGEDVTSSCKLNLKIVDIDNCTSLKDLVLNHLNVLMPSDRIGFRGYNDPQDQAMWITVLRDFPSLEEASSTTPAPDTTPGTETTVATTATTDNTTATNDTLPPYVPIDNLLGICYNITTAIHLTVLWAESGKLNNYTIREIVGARISFTVGDWQLSCSGANSASCSNNSQFAQPFLLTSSVAYLKVPASIPNTQISFYTRRDRSCTTDSCERFYTDYDQSVCKYDICWNELLYPLSASYGADPPMYTLAFSLLAVLFIVGYFMITRPWF